MDYEFFQSLTAEDARTFLNRFLEVERQGMQETEARAATEQVECDYSIETLADVLRWMARQTRVCRKPVPESEPSWIRQAHGAGIKEFDDDSKAVLLRAGYYLGECFARLPGLRWATGDPEYMEKHMPVVVGFRDDQELPPLVVVQNMFARIVGDGRPSLEIEDTLNMWLKDCPGAFTRSLMHIERLNQPIFDLPADHPARRFLESFIECRRTCVGRELDGVDQRWVSDTDGKEHSFSAFAYEALSFDVVLDGWLSAAQALTASESDALAAIPIMWNLVVECKIAAIANRNYEIVRLCDKVFATLLLWKECIEYRVAQN